MARTTSRRTSNAVVARAWRQTGARGRAVVRRQAPECRSRTAEGRTGWRGAVVACARIGTRRSCHRACLTLLYACSTPSQTAARLTRQALVAASCFRAHNTLSCHDPPSRALQEGGPRQGEEARNKEHALRASFAHACRMPIEEPACARDGAPRSGISTISAMRLLGINAAKPGYIVTGRL